DATLIVTVRDGETAINDATVAVRGDMSHAGMIPVMVEASEGTEGEYEIPFEWTMGGDWAVEITATLPDGRSTQRTFEYSLPGSPDDMDMDGMDMSDDEMDDMDMDAMSTDDAMSGMDMSDDTATEEAGE
ncbi:MAG: FixH family protein, partial [Aggregatilineales bacterium]